MNNQIFQQARSAYASKNYEAALGAHHALRGSKLVTVTSNGNHGQYPGSDPCVTGTVERYLLDGRIPEHDLTCPAPSAG